MKLLRFILCLALILAPVQSVFASTGCSLDGTQAIGTTYSPSVTARTFVLATSQPNDIVFLFVSVNAETNTTFPLPAVTSVVGGGLTWTRRGASQESIPSCWLGGTCYVDSEEWVALAPTPVSSATITVNVNSDLGYSNFNVIGIHGASSFDPAVTSTAFAKNLTNSASTVAVTNFSTAASPDTVLFVCNVYTATSGLDCGYNSTVLPWSGVTGIFQQNIFIGFGLETQSFERLLMAPASMITLAPFTTPTGVWIAAADAVVCPSGASNVNVQIIE